MTTTYVRFELLRTFRATRFFLFTLGFPLILFYLIAGPNRHETLDGIDLSLYLMSGMAAWGAMGAVIGTGGRIAAERSIGWHRQLRLTPLPTRTYFAAKVVAGYAMALASIAVLFLAGVSLGVDLPPSRWLVMTALILVGLVPFAALGVLLGHLLSVDSLGPAMGGITSLFALFGGAWGPIASGGAVRRLAELLPSYWLVQAGHTALDGGTWPAKAWLVMGVWSVVLARLAVGAWRRDTARV
jgi:ABC-2 type transport system permease protein